MEIVRHTLGGPGSLKGVVRPEKHPWKPLDMETIGRSWNAPGKAWTTVGSPWDICKAMEDPWKPLEAIGWSWNAPEKLWNSVGSPWEILPSHGPPVEAAGSPWKVLEGPEKTWEWGCKPSHGFAKPCNTLETLDKHWAVLGRLWKIQEYG